MRALLITDADDLFDSYFENAMALGGMQHRAGQLQDAIDFYVLALEKAFRVTDVAAVFYALGTSSSRDEVTVAMTAVLLWGLTSRHCILVVPLPVPV